MASRPRQLRPHAPSSTHLQGHRVESFFGDLTAAADLDEDERAAMTPRIERARALFGASRAISARLGFREQTKGEMADVRESFPVPSSYGPSACQYYATDPTGRPTVIHRRRLGETTAPMSGNEHSEAEGYQPGDMWPLLLTHEGLVLRRQRGAPTEALRGPRTNVRETLLDSVGTRIRIGRQRRRQGCADQFRAPSTRWLSREVARDESVQCGVVGSDRPGPEPSEGFRRPGPRLPSAGGAAQGPAASTCPIREGRCGPAHVRPQAPLRLPMPMAGSPGAPRELRFAVGRRRRSRPRARLVRQDREPSPAVCRVPLLPFLGENIRGSRAFKLLILLNLASHMFSDNWRFWAKISMLMVVFDGFSRRLDGAQGIPRVPRGLEA